MRFINLIEKPRVDAIYFAFNVFTPIFFSFINQLIIINSTVLDTV